MLPSAGLVCRARLITSATLSSSGARPAGAELVVQPFQTEILVALAPLADGHPCRAHSLGDSGVAFTGAAGQHDLGALNNRMRQRSGMGKFLQMLNLMFAENQRRHRKSKRQGVPPVTPLPADPMTVNCHDRLIRSAKPSPSLEGGC